jgi:GT2 family glycosyltransferase
LHFFQSVGWFRFHDCGFSAFEDSSVVLCRCRLPDLRVIRDFQHEETMGSEPFVSIVMTYYERLPQLKNTLRSFQLLGYTRFECVIVDDGSVDKPLSDASLDGLGFPVTLVRMPTEKTYTNSCVPFNTGLSRARGDVVIIQNAECLHAADLLGYARANLTDRDYLSFACYSLSRSKTTALCEMAAWDISDVKRMLTEDRGAGVDGDDGWYNHSVRRPVGYHFASAITRHNLDRLGGFDPRYAYGVAFDDDELLVRIRRLGLQVTIVDDHVVAHQWHYAAPRRRGWKPLWARNLLLLRLVTMRERGVQCSKLSLPYVLYRIARPVIVAGLLVRSAVLEALKRN